MNKRSSIAKERNLTFQLNKKILFTRSTKICELFELAKEYLPVEDLVLYVNNTRVDRRSTLRIKDFFDGECESLNMAVDGNKLMIDNVSPNESFEKTTSADKSAFGQYTSKSSALKVKKLKPTADDSLTNSNSNFYNSGEDFMTSKFVDRRMRDDFASSSNLRCKKELVKFCSPETNLDLYSHLLIEVKTWLEGVEELAKQIKQAKNAAETVECSDDIINAVDVIKATVYEREQIKTIEGREKMYSFRGNEITYEVKYFRSRMKNKSLMKKLQKFKGIIDEFKGEEKRYEYLGIDRGSSVLISGGNNSQKLKDYIYELEIKASELTKNNREISKLEKENQNLKLKNIKLTQDLAELDRISKNLQSEIESNQRERVQLKQLNKEFDSQAEEIKEQYLQLDLNFKGIQDNYAILEQDYVSLEEKNRDFTLELEEKKNEIKLLYSRIDQERCDFEDKMQNRDGELERALKEGKRLKNEISSMEIEISTKRDEMTELMVERKDLIQQSTKKDFTIRELKNRLEEAKNKGKELVSKISSGEEYLNTGESDQAFEKIQSGIEKKEQENSQIRREKANLEVELKQTKREIERETGKFKVENKKVCLLEGKIGEFNDKIEKLENLLRDEKRKFTGISADLTVKTNCLRDSESKIEELNRVLRGKEEDFKKLKREKEELNSVLVSVKSDLEGKITKIEDLNSKLTQKQADLDKNNQILEQKQTLILKTQSELENYKSKNESLLEQIAELQAETEISSQMVDKLKFNENIKKEKLKNAEKRLKELENEVFSLNKLLEDERRENQLELEKIKEELRINVRKFKSEIITLKKAQKEGTEMKKLLKNYKRELDSYNNVVSRLKEELEYLQTENSVVLKTKTSILPTEVENKFIYSLTEKCDVLVFECGKRQFVDRFPVKNQAFLDCFDEDNFLIVGSKKGFFILTGENCDRLFEFNGENMLEVGRTEEGHKQAGLLYLEGENGVAVLGGKFTKKNEFISLDNVKYSFRERRVIPDSHCRLAQASYLLLDNKEILCFFGYNNDSREYSNKANRYCLWDKTWETLSLNTEIKLKGALSFLSPDQKEVIFLGGALVRLSLEDNQVQLDSQSKHKFSRNKTSLSLEREVFFFTDEDKVAVYHTKTKHLTTII